MTLEVERDPTGSLWLRGLTPLCVDTLLNLPQWLGSDDERVRARLLPRVYEDPDEEAQWRRLGASGLEHLMMSRTEILRRDLSTLSHDGPLSYSLRIASGHETAWLSGLNGGRLALFELTGLQPSDMERDPSTLGDPEKELALLRIHLMAWMQELLLELMRS